MKSTLQRILKHAFVLNIYTYSSLMSEGGLGNSLFKDFEKSTDIKTHVTTFSDSFQMVNQLELDNKLHRKLPDILLGFDQNTWPRVRPFADLWETWRPKDFEKLQPFLKVENGFLPFDYGEFGFIANIELLKKNKLEKPKKLSDLLKTEWKRKFILEDPRLSTPGLFFLRLSKEKIKDPQDFWNSLKSQWLTLAPGWSAAYSLFLKNEAPLVWSYKTSIAYHRSEKKGHLYEFVALEEGAPLQIEGAAIIENKNTESKAAAEKFLSYLISEKAQKNIPETQWMLPARKNIALPGEFKDLDSKDYLNLKPLSSGELENSLALWKKSISR